MFTFRGRRRFELGQLVSSHEGSAAVEFAVLCGVVVCSLAVGIYFLGQISKAAMSSAAVAIGSGHAGDPLTSPVSAPDTHASEDAAKSQATDVAQTGSHWQMAAIVAAMLVACGAPLSFILLRSRRQLREPSRKPAADESPQHAGTRRAGLCKASANPTGLSKQYGKLARWPPESATRHVATTDLRAEGGTASRPFWK